MSVQTTADELRDEIIEDLDKLIKKINRLVFDDVWGWDDYTTPYQNRMIDFLVYLKKQSKEL